MQPLHPSDRVIDYAHSPLKSDWMDVFLCARCRFFLGSSSGLFLISSAFGVPSALTNVAPIGCSYSFFRKDISIPKIYESAEKIPIAFPILFASPVADFRWNYLLEGSDVVLKANSSKETLDLTCEMLDRLDGTYIPDPESERRQTAFRALFHEQNYSWASCARIGDAFLRDHEKLLEDVPSPPNRYDAITWSDGPLRNPAAGTRRRGKPSRVVG